MSNNYEKSIDDALANNHDLDHLPNQLIKLVYETAEKVTMIESRLAIARTPVQILKRALPQLQNDLAALSYNLKPTERLKTDISFLKGLIYDIEKYLKTNGA